MACMHIVAVCYVCCSQSVEGEPHEKAVELLKAAQGLSHMSLILTLSHVIDTVTVTHVIDTDTVTYVIDTDTVTDC